MEGMEDGRFAEATEILRWKNTEWMGFRIFCHRPNREACGWMTVGSLPRTSESKTSQCGILQEIHPMLWKVAVSVHWTPLLWS
jgi:hypothetical protein